MQEVEKILKVGSSQEIPTPKTSYSSSNKDSYACSYINNALENIETLDEYSTTETRVGTWLGKPLYRKVVYISNLPNNTSIDYDIFDDTSIIDDCHINGNSFYVDSNFNIPINTPFDASSLCYAFITNNKKLRIYCASDRSSQYSYVIVEYTKTTDQIPQNINRSKMKGAKK